MNTVMYEMNYEQMCFFCSRAQMTFSFSEDFLSLQHYLIWRSHKNGHRRKPITNLFFLVFDIYIKKENWEMSVKNVTDIWLLQRWKSRFDWRITQTLRSPINFRKPGRNHLRLQHGVQKHIYQHITSFAEAKRRLPNLSGAEGCA